MGPITLAIRLSFAVAVSFSVSGCIYPGGIVPAPEKEQIVGVWSAIEGDWAVVRVRLNAYGTGLLGATFHDEPVMLYRVLSWQLTDKEHVEKGELEAFRTIVIDVEPIGKARPLKVDGSAGRMHLLLNLVWSEWSPRQLRFSREGVVEGLFLRTKTAMEEHEAQ